MKINRHEMQFISINHNLPELMTIGRSEYCSLGGSFEGDGKIVNCGWTEIRVSDKVAVEFRSNLTGAFRMAAGSIASCVDAVIGGLLTTVGTGTTDGAVSTFVECFAGVLFNETK